MEHGVCDEFTGDAFRLAGWGADDAARFYRVVVGPPLP